MRECFSPRGTEVDLVEEVDLALRVFRRGTRPEAAAPCKLTLSLNGRERLIETVEAGTDAPAEAFIDIRTDARVGERMIQALAARPWLIEDMPVIVFERPGHAPDDPRRIGYMVRSSAMDQVIEAVRDVLDLVPKADIQQDRPRPHPSTAA